MSINFWKKALAASMMVTSLSTFAEGGSDSGSKGGGGGDAQERKFDEVREDILNWIEDGGAKELTGVDYPTYEKKMKDILQRQKVVVTFVTLAEELAFPHLKVTIKGKKKTCRSFYVKADKKYNILCNVERFALMTDPELYPFIHHEFAGIVGLEKNDEAASDYHLSNQLTAYLEVRPETKLAIVKKKFQPLQGSDCEKVMHEQIKMSELEIKQFQEEIVNFRTSHHIANSETHKNLGRFNWLAVPAGTALGCGAGIVMTRMAHPGNDGLGGCMVGAIGGFIAGGFTFVGAYLLELNELNNEDQYDRLQSDFEGMKVNHYYWNLMVKAKADYNLYGQLSKDVQEEVISFFTGYIQRENNYNAGIFAMKVRHYFSEPANHGKFLTIGFGVKEMDGYLCTEERAKTLPEFAKDLQNIVY